MSTPPLIVPTPASAGAAGDDFPTPFTLDVRSILALLPDDGALDDWFLRFTAENDDLGYQFEIDEAGKLLAMASESLDGAHRSMNILVDLYRWAEDGPGGMAVTGNALIRTLGWGRRAPVHRGNRFAIEPVIRPASQDGNVDCIGRRFGLAH